MHLVAIIGDHGDQWHRFPVVARSTSHTFLFLDHRMFPSRRVAAARDACDLSTVTVFERVESAPCPTDCPAGIHPWTRIREDAATVAGRCPACGLVEMIPEPMPLRAREMAHAN